MDVRPHGELAQKVNEKLGSAGGNTGGSSGSKNDLPAAPFTVKVLIGDLNYRSEPSMSGAVKGQTGKGVFTISEVKDGWGKLKSGAGWIYLENPEYCTVLGKIASTPAQTSSSYMVRITTSVLNVRKGPGTNYGITTKVKKGEVYTIVAEEKNGNTTWGQAEIRRRIYQPGLYRKSAGGNGGIMKNYIGVKIVKAEPKEKNGVPGYAVKYPDGYVSWSPKETFEKAYRELDCQDFINSAE